MSSAKGTVSAAIPLATLSKVTWWVAPASLRTLYAAYVAVRAIAAHSSGTIARRRRWAGERAFRTSRTITAARATAVTTLAVRFTARVTECDTLKTWTGLVGQFRAPSLYA